MQRNEAYFGQRYKRLASALDSITKQADKIGSDRNARIHSPMTNTAVDSGKVVLSTIRLSGKATHLTHRASKPYPRDWVVVRGNI